MPLKFYKESKIKCFDGQQVLQPSRLAWMGGEKELVFPLLSCEKSLADGLRVLGAALTTVIALLTS